MFRYDRRNGKLIFNLSILCRIAAAALEEILNDGDDVIVIFGL